MLHIDTGLLYWGLFISLIGMGFFMYGKKRADGTTIITGIVLCFYPYFVSSLTWSIVVGIAVIAVYVFLKRIVGL